VTKGIVNNKHLSRPVPPAASAAIARELLLKVKEIGGDPQLLLTRAGLTQSAAELLRPSGRGTLPHAAFVRLYAHCTWELDECSSRQEGRRPLSKAEFDLFCYCVINCRTLRAVIERTVSFNDMIFPRMGRVTLRVNGPAAVLEMASQRTIFNSCAYLTDLTGLSSYHRLFGWLIGEDIELQAIDMQYPPLLSARTRSYLMPHPINHREAENRLRFPAHYLDRPVMRSYAELEQLLRYFPFDLEEPKSKESPFSERIAQILETALISGDALPTAARLARLFSISQATLKRRLGEEGASLSGLKAERRRELAQRLLFDQRLTIGEIARRSQYSDAGAFGRAFHQWTGQSPYRWRRLNCPA
jgi:AraC-like DNA-binding protein